MHKIYHPGNCPTNYDFEEYCPFCDNAIPVKIDHGDYDHYEFTCPVCGEKLMLCTLCHDDHGDKCDWTEQTGCGMMNRG